MNAIVGLCHFCEAHGPRPVFCTFTTEDESDTTNGADTSNQCNGCTSIGHDTAYVSRDDNGTIYCSRESIANPEVNTFLRQAAVRSITCEVSWSKDGGVIYFSDIRGHVLSFTFQLKDTKARGLKRWFSIIILMKDKTFLLSVTPFLSEHMQKIAKELQGHAENVFDEEQSVCSQRALRLNTGSNYFGQSRSLVQLTGKEDIFKNLHSHFTWMLKAGALTYIEQLHTSQDLLDKVNSQRSQGVSIFTPNICSVPTVEECMALRALENLLGAKTFKTLVYCILTGVDIILKCNQETPDILKGLSRLLPVTKVENIPNVNTSDDEVTAAANKCVLMKTENSIYCCQWSGSLPEKCPTLMSKIEASMKNSKFEDAVLHQHVKSLVLEWLGIARAVKAAITADNAKSESVVKLKQVLGVTPQDELLVQHWIHTFCT